jgi:ABC-type branched-subunit amino acid transport system ATPase component
MSPTLRLAARVTDVSLRYRRIVALEGVQLELPAACIVGVIGPDGVGKSSLLALIAGAGRIQSGTVETLGGNMANRSASECVLALPICPRAWVAICTRAFRSGRTSTFSGGCSA